MSEVLSFGNAALGIAIIALSIFAAHRALRTSRTPQGAVAWILLIIFVPLLGTLIYFFFGHVDYQGFKRERRKSDDAVFGADQHAAKREASPRLEPFANIADLPVSEGNTMALLIDGPATFDAVFRAIADAKFRVFVQFYTIKDDHIGRALRDVLIERAEAGLDIWVLHDELPLFGLSARFKRPMIDAGVRFATPKGPKRLLGRFQLNYRNHRKLVIVDNEVAFTGGLNVSKTYVGESKIGPWRDTFARFEGPIVAQLGMHFASDWYWATDVDLSYCFMSVEEPKGEVKAVALAPSPVDGIASGNLFFIAAAHAAQHRLWIATPYFVPDRDVLTALRFAALRGVDVKILVPSWADHYLTFFAAMAYFDDIRSVGGEVWTYDPAFMHQKVVLVDDDLSSVGSINLDIRSGLLNFEVTVVMDDKDAALDIQSMLETDFANATRIDFDLGDRPWIVRTLAQITRLFAPVL